MAASVRIYVLLCALFSLGCRSEIAGDELVRRSANTIELCVERLSMVTKSDLPHEIDGAVAFVPEQKDVVSVLFVRGEAGLFGPRTEDYSTYFLCSTTYSGDPRILRLERFPFAIPLIDTPEDSPGHFPLDDTVQSLKFVRGESGFHLEDIKPFNPKGLDPNGAAGRLQ